MQQMWKQSPIDVKNVPEKNKKNLKKRDKFFLKKVCKR